MADRNDSGLTWADLAWLRGERVAPNGAIADQWAAEIHDKIAALLRREELARLSLVNPKTTAYKWRTSGSGEMICHMSDNRADGHPDFSRIPDSEDVSP